MIENNYTTNNTNTTFKGTDAFISDYLIVRTQLQKFPDLQKTFIPQKIFKASISI